MKLLTFSCTNVWIVSWCVHSSSCGCVGSSPWMSRYATSRYVECSASCSIGYPRYSSTPASPSRNVIAERQEAVFMNAGSYDMTPKSSSSTLISRSAVARMVPSSRGTSYVRPVRLSVIVSESDAVAVPPPFVLCSSVPIALLCEGGSSRSLHCGGADAPGASRRDDGRDHRARDEHRADQHDRPGGPVGRRERLVPRAPVDPQAEPEQDQQPGEDVERRLRRLIGRQQEGGEHRDSKLAHLPPLGGRHLALIGRAELGRAVRLLG